MMRALLFSTVFIGTAATPWDSEPPTLATAAAKVSSAFTHVSALLSAASEDFHASAYRTEAVERGDIVTTVQAAGTLNAVVTVEVGSQISGLVKELYVDFNSRVTEGDVIARVAPEMYESRVKQAEAELEMAETQVSVQRAQIERVRADLENAEARHASASAQTTLAEVAQAEAAQEMERKRTLVQGNVITAGEWERSQNAQKSTEAQVTAARADQLSYAAAIRSAQAALTMAEAQLANTLAQVKQKKAMLRQAQIDLDRTYIRTPVTGTVVYRAVSGGQTLAASLQTPTLFTIAQDLTRMQVEASVVEADISRFAVGQPVTFNVDAFPERRFVGTVKQIRKAPQMVQNVVTYVAVIAAENPDELLLPGMTANLQVVTARREGVLMVPNAALRYSPTDGVAAEADMPLAAPSNAIGRGGMRPGIPGRIFVPEANGEPRPVALRLGITDGRMTEIVAGDLTEGQQVVIGHAAAPGGDTDASSVMVRFRLR
ncbi:MAG: efflux RND transporter periplasmic adaptor subunit [Mesorhizobium sp.]|uniref:efflux RND transporter periplasmic adaptor subunit n=1 Tax=Mesorhizobium sp. TaxID=1871066 RepID=UPI000FE6089B|nr:efflux RND transporter periplasmic adaptor subunit [Mesorhizobium sp.]RWP12695.1 MAG: efflux RND transporter periplasmic adaptor subunit [Mesorhizobium sp.]